MIVFKEFSLIVKNQITRDEHNTFANQTILSSKGSVKSLSGYRYSAEVKDDRVMPGPGESLGKNNISHPFAVLLTKFTKISYTNRGPQIQTFVYK